MDPLDRKGMKNELDYDPDAIGGKDAQDDYFGDSDVNDDGEDKKELEFEDVSDDLADDKDDDDKDEDEEHDYGEENL